ncbi:hypothetical protein AB0J84_24035 [Micromonospora arborensis]|uniref:hypothetical protein n=1 Tax=Micromonospora arborensis TaxID=2116518 RepID=UPI003413F8F2
MNRQPTGKATGGHRRATAHQRRAQPSDGHRRPTGTAERRAPPTDGHRRATGTADRRAPPSDGQTTDGQGSPADAMVPADDGVVRGHQHCDSVRWAAAT